MDKYGRKSFALNSAIALRDVYRLFLVFGGDERFFDLTPEANDPLRLRRQTYFADEIVHLLVGSAVANRIHLEHMSQLRANPASPKHSLIDFNCGTLWPDVLNGKGEVPLSFAQACNKIIHALHIVPSSGDPSENPLTSEVKLRGNRQCRLVRISQHSTVCSRVGLDLSRRCMMALDRPATVAVVAKRRH